MLMDEVLPTKTKRKEHVYWCCCVFISLVTRQDGLQNLNTILWQNLFGKKKKNYKIKWKQWLVTFIGGFNTWTRLKGHFALRWPTGLVSNLSFDCRLNCNSHWKKGQKVIFFIARNTRISFHKAHLSKSVYFIFTCEKSQYSQSEWSTAVFTCGRITNQR